MSDQEVYKPRPGDIGLVAMGGMIRRAIRFGQWLNGDGYHDYQHAFMYVGQNKIMEAMPGGARMADISRYKADEILWLRCPEKYGQDVAQAAVSFHGVPYSFLDYGALALHRFKIPTPRLKAYIESSKHQICSQLVDRAAVLGGWHIFDDGRWSGDVTPGDLTKCAMQAKGVPGERFKVSR